MRHIAPGQDYSLPLVKVGRGKFKVQPDRKQVRHLKGIYTNLTRQRALVINGLVPKLWKTS